MESKKQVIFLADVFDVVGSESKETLLLSDDGDELEVDKAKIFEPKENQDEAPRFDKVDLPDLRKILALPRAKKLQFIQAVSRGDFALADNLRAEEQNLASAYKILPPTVHVAVSLACLSFVIENVDTSQKDELDALRDEIVETIDGAAMCAYITRQLCALPEWPASLKEVTVFASQVASISTLPLQINITDPSVDQDVHMTGFWVTDQTKERGSKLANRFHHALREHNLRKYGASCTLLLFSKGMTQPRKAFGVDKMCEQITKGAAANRVDAWKMRTNDWLRSELQRWNFKWEGDYAYPPSGSFFFMFTVGCTKDAHNELSWQAENLLELSDVDTFEELTASLTAMDWRRKPQATPAESSGPQESTISSAQTDRQSKSAGDSVKPTAPESKQHWDRVRELERDWLQGAKKRVDDKDMLAPSSCENGTVSFTFPDYDMAKFAPELFKARYPDVDARTRISETEEYVRFLRDSARVLCEDRLTA